MGGSAFSSFPNPPYTPRMPHAIYQRARANCHALLRELFICVATPIEGPGKEDHGDVDVLVALERRLVFPTTPDDSVQRTPHQLMAATEHLLGAAHAIVHPTGTSAYFAIEWPPEEGRDVSASDRAANAGGATDGCDEPKKRHIQVDITICPDVERLCWGLFKHAHGDLWNLIGSTIRPYGLTVDEEALWIRIPDIEGFDRKRAKVRLSRDPVEVLHFLGMKVEGFWTEPFESVDALFDYVTTCRLFWVQETPELGAEGGQNDAGIVGGEEGRKRLKANDRRRMKGRPVYRRWIDEFIPSLCAEGRFVLRVSGTSIEQVRAAVRDEAFAFFFVEAAYNWRLRDWRLQKEAERMKALIKDLVPSTLDPSFRGCLVSAMRKIVMEDDQSFGIVSPGPFRDVDGFYNIELTCNFVRDNWEQVGKITRATQRQRAQEAMRRKASDRETEMNATQEASLDRPDKERVMRGEREGDSGHPLIGTPGS